MRDRYASSLGVWDEVVAKVAALAPIATDLGCSQSQLAIAWCVKNPNVSSVIMGGSTVAQLRENLMALHCLSALTDEVMQQLDEIFPVRFRGPTFKG